ncbi:mycofactocin biosynthesis peptidyl-dipeptidase MftE [Phytoactinopolyspora halotolerans]|uniref:Mycofactocin biosynthesis peptidyl-dipeptidase MftE n=1 Tax=Phytoactinopolyspora halotolerans TaxID=1981512 RepID=A0A6L9S7R0_9ACTN|nr:mycofactocin biosynthesis peptidyl-dipeptidase MftE [Phytoactinopolyspora halotolerans]NEE01057.1 mycofactocin biosynthesis peptidyl-dipeptidase MftE [Phytoactinopolyspora halotolerans]
MSPQGQPVRQSRPSVDAGSAAYPSAGEERRGARTRPEKWLADRPWPDVGRPVVVLPLGSTEQHGPHLPLDTDTVIATAVACGLAERITADGTDSVVAPPMAYGASGEHEQFAGTVSLGRDALEFLLIEYGRSICRWAERLVIVNGHGGNVDALDRAVRRLVSEGRDAVWTPCLIADDDTQADDGPAPPTSPATEPATPDVTVPRVLDAHAGRLETSLMLHLAPERVLLDRAEAGNLQPLSEILPALRRGGVAAVAANGVLGDPHGASAAEGARLLDSMIDTAWRRTVARRAVARRADSSQRTGSTEVTHVGG